MVTRSLLLTIAMLPGMAYAQGLQGLDFDTLTRPGKEPGFVLPTQEEMTQPPGYDRFLQMADEIARQSAKEHEASALEAAKQLDVLPLDDEAESNVDLASDAPSWGASRLPQGYRVTIMVSAALGDRALKALFETYAGRPDVRFAFRGVPADMTVPDFAVWLQSLFENPTLMEMTQIVIDPDLFRATDASLAPTIVLEDLGAASSVDEDSDTGRILATATGFSNPDWIYDRYLRGETQYPNADAVLVTEEDLRDRAEREAAAKLATLTTDPDVLVDRYWNRLSKDLGRAPVTPANIKRERQIHASFVPKEAIRDNDGRILAYPGEVFNPSTILPFDRQVLVFDPSRPGELDFVTSRLASPPEAVTRQVLIVTRIPDVANGEPVWFGLQRLVDRFHLPVYVLTADFRRAFGIEHTPSEISPRRDGQNLQVIVTETVISGGG